MKVQIFPGDEKGVGWARMRWPAEYVARHGVEIDDATELPIIRGTRKTDGRQVIAPDREKLTADVLVFQRPSNRELVALIPALQTLGHAVVVDVDDAVDVVSWANRAKVGEDPTMVARACALADVVTASTPALVERFGAHGRAILVRNCVPETLLKMPRSTREDRLTVGWGGWVGTHPHDLQVTRGGVAEAVRRAGARFQVIGPPDGVRIALGLDEEPGATGGVPVVAYHAALGTLDVGIAPLEDTAFNRAKSWLKPLEYTARGVAAVMSPLPEYERLHADGIGVLAKSRARNWCARVNDLLTSADAREELVARGQAAIADHHTYATEWWQWAEAWEAALENHRARRRPEAA